MNEAETVVVTKLGEPIRVQITRSAKGKYQWEVTVSAATADEALEVGIHIDKQLEIEYHGRASGETEEKEK